MAEHAAPKKHKSSGSIVPYLTTPLFLLLLSAGIIVLCYALMPTHYIQKYLNLAFMDDLKTTSTTAGLNIVENDIETEPGEKPTYDKGSIVYPHFGEQYAIISAPAIKLTAGVYYGSSGELLERGVCQSTQSAYIADGGHTVIDGHVNTFFSDLGKLQLGDEVILYTKYGTFKYKVSELISFNKSDKTYVSVTENEEEHLTIYTCQPQVLGSSDLRIGVQCVPVEKDYYFPIEDDKTEEEGETT